MLITRRTFLKNAAAPLALAALSTTQVSDDDLAGFRAELLKLVNTERLLAGVTALAADDLASEVAARHALDMASAKFLSHWGSDGRKPYHRYAAAGGFHVVMENVSSADKLESLSAKYIGQSLNEMHMQMHAERPPNDGHRRTILAPEHTHVGFGVAIAERSLRLVEMYVGKYIELEPFPRLAKPRASINIKGKLMSSKHEFAYAEVFYEPLPKRAEIDWLRVGRPYGLPDEYVVLRPIPHEGTYYADGAVGKIDVDGKRFRIPVDLYKSEPGIYTVAILLKKFGSREKFRVTNICIQAE
ncbi:MAG TPA: CAP domain-containing protein [Blastocatellia bacterium]|nr:CAP domain-containing protein [Blastocatellia bacterium]